jgi:AraC family transcriptional activator of tynA and feaB
MLVFVATRHNGKKWSGSMKEKPAIVLEDATISAATHPKQDPLTVFTEAIESFPVRCRFEYEGDEPFHTQWTSARTERASAIRWKCAAHTTRRTENDVADSIQTGYGALFAASGGAVVMQNGKQGLVRPGELALYDLDQPLKVAMLEGARRDFVLVTIPHATLERFHEHPSTKSSLQMITGKSPLFHCVQHIGAALAARTTGEFSPLLEACEHLLAVELLASAPGDSSDARRPAASSHLLDSLIAVIDREIPNRKLSPQWLAQHFGVSTRYVHKLFAQRGMTCQAYIVSRRLAHARHDMALSMRPMHISTLAFRWGFSNPASFSRAFRSQFGCSPRDYRLKVRK